MFTLLRRGHLGCRLSAPHYLQLVKSSIKGKRACLLISAYIKNIFTKSCIIQVQDYLIGMNVVLTA